jgi:spermidine synthase
LLIVPSLLLGMSFPLLLNVASSAGGKVASRVGGVYSMNTLGTVVGSVATGFFLLPALGSLTSLRCAATASLAVGVGFGLFNRAIARPGKVVVVLAAVGIGALVWFGPGEWDPRHITGDSYVYFKPARVNDRILYLGEDVQGGMTAVVQTGPTRQLLSNGKFEGNNSGEVGAQIRFALVPALFTSHFDRALVIGLGTGNTLRTVSQFPFKAIDAIELAPHIVEAARLFFENENQLVFDRDPRVHLTVADGRNHLLLTRQTYDLITIEITSIWISGEADLYNREFYELCRARLGREGVLQQWVQIHHMRPTDLLVLLNTAAQVFPHAAFFLGPEQGLLIASAAPLTVDYQRIAALDADPGVRHELDAIHAPSMFSLLGEMVLYEGSFARAAGSLPQRGLPRDFASSDLEPYLEYATPKGNTLPYDTRPLNTELLESFRGPWPLPSNLPSASEGELVLGYLTEAVGEPEQAVAHWERVEGPSRERAQAEIARVRAAKP